MKYAKNFVLTMLTKFLYFLGLKPKFSPGQKRKILIVSTTGFGDTLWATPALAALKKAHPEGTISVLTSPIGKEVLQNNPHVDELFLYPRPFFPFCFPLLGRLRLRKFDTVIVFHASQRLAIPLINLIGAKIRIGCEGELKGLDQLFTQLLPKKNHHEIEKRLDLVEYVGAEKELLPLEYHFDREETKALDPLFAQGKAPFVAFHPGAKNLYKQWPPDYYAEVGKKLQQMFGATIFVTGSSTEKSLVKKIARDIPGAIAFCNYSHISELAALLSRIDLFITNDTGPMHLGDALQIPMIAIFAPTSPETSGPKGKKNCKVLAKPRTCTPCIRKQCLLPFCMMQISPKEVIEAAISFLDKRERKFSEESMIC